MREEAMSNIEARRLSEGGTSSGVAPGATAARALWPERQCSYSFQQNGGRVCRLQRRAAVRSASIIASRSASVVSGLMRVTRRYTPFGSFVCTR